VVTLAAQVPVPTAPGKGCALSAAEENSEYGRTSRVECGCQQITRRLVESDEPHLFHRRWR